MRILGTDYENYYVKYSCRNNMWDMMHWEGWAIFVRNHDISEEKLVEAKELIYDKVPDTDISYWTTHETKHSWCEYDWKL